MTREYHRHCPRCPTCGCRIVAGVCDCNRVLAGEPTNPFELSSRAAEARAATVAQTRRPPCDPDIRQWQKRSRLASEALDEDEAEVRRRLDAPEGQEHVAEPLLYSGERKAAETTVEAQGVKIDGTVFLGESTGGYPKSSGSKRPGRLAERGSNTRRGGKNQGDE